MHLVAPAADTQEPIVSAISVDPIAEATRRVNPVVVSPDLVPPSRGASILKAGHCQLNGDTMVYVDGPNLNDHYGSRADAMAYAHRRVVGNATAGIDRVGPARPLWLDENELTARPALVDGDKVYRSWFRLSTTM